MESEVNTQGIDNLATLLVMEKWRERLRSHLEAKQITQETVAERLGMTQGAVGHWLTGRNKITLEQFARLCKAAEANAQMVLFGTAPTGAELINEIRQLVGSTPTPDVSRNPTFTEKRQKEAKKPSYRGKDRRKTPGSSRREPRTH